MVVRRAAVQFFCLFTAQYRYSYTRQAALKITGQCVVVARGTTGRWHEKKKEEGGYWLSEGNGEQGQGKGSFLRSSVSRGRPLLVLTTPGFALKRSFNYGHFAVFTNRLLAL